MNLNGLDREIDGAYTNPPVAENLAIKREILGVPLLVIGFIFLVGTLFYIGVHRNAYYQAQASSSRISRFTLPAPRGQILDRNGNVLAINHSTYDCYFVTSSDEDVDIENLTNLGAFLTLNDEQIEIILESRRSSGSERSLESELSAAERGVAGARSILIKRDLNQIDVTSLLERKYEFPSVFLERSYRRSYPAGEATAQLLGYIGQISESELNDRANLGYSGGDSVGKGGLESQYDYFLRGEAGERLVSVDARGRILGNAEMVPAVVPNGGVVVVSGDNVLVLNDGEIGELTLGTYPRTNRDGDIVKDRDDEVVIDTDDVYLKIENGMFEARSYRFSSEPADYGVIFVGDQKNDGSFNTFTGKVYYFLEPGQVAIVDGIVKMRPPVTQPSAPPPLRLTLDLPMQIEIGNIMGEHVGGVIAMDPRDGAILAMVSNPGYDPNLFSPTGVDREGWQAIMDDPNFPMLNRPVQNAYVPGSVYKIITALSACENHLSSGTWDCRGSIEVGNRTFRCWNRGGHGRVNFTEAMAVSCDVAFWEMGQLLGHDKIGDMSYRFGLGTKLGIDLPEERDGLIPTEEWKINRFGEDERWYTGDTMNMSIGQGFVQLTILQVARMTSVVANGGYLVPPHLNRILTPSSQANIERLDIPVDDLNLVRRGLRRCITEGTGRGTNLSWIGLAGKTGTADDPPREDPHSWFLSYGPYDDPCMVLVVMCENGGHGDEKAVPLARQIWESESVRGYLSEQGVDIE